VSRTRVVSKNRPKQNQSGLTEPSPAWAGI
jgi:hypothetical protein